MKVVTELLEDAIDYFEFEYESKDMKWKFVNTINEEYEGDIERFLREECHNEDYGSAVPYLRNLYYEASRNLF